MKKALALLLLLAMTCSITVALSDTYTGWDAAVSGMTTQLTMEVTEAHDHMVYIIPPTIEIDPTAKETTISVTLQAGWYLRTPASLTMSVTSNNGGYLVKDGDTDIKIPYTVTAKPCGIQAVQNGVSYWNEMTLTGTAPLKLFAIQAGADVGGNNNEDHTVELCVKVDSLPADGVYTDILTFAWN